MDTYPSKSKKKMVVITSYFAGGTYGLLGPQLAATLIEAHTPYACIVIAISREDDKSQLKEALFDYFGSERPIIGFSSLSGREDLFNFAKELKEEGCFTLLAGPQADVDFRGEVGCGDFPHRFQGLSGHFSCALQGPAEQSFGLLAAMDVDRRRDVPGLLFIGPGGKVVQRNRLPWNERYFGSVRWDNICRLEKSRITPHRVDSAQVLQQIGCPHAARRRKVEIDYPAFFYNRKGLTVASDIKGCSFCDVAVDKGFRGVVSPDAVLDQIGALPVGPDGRKIPFELINENPLAGLLPMLYGAEKRKIPLSRINLIMRADWFVRGFENLREALSLAGEMGIRIVLASVGFESFDDTILRNLNKGLTVQTILKAVSRMRRLKDEFPNVWGYSRADGANHGFIHPTPWDSEQTSLNIREIIDRYALAPDILPEHSTPLIIHHASGLADWIREVEKRERVRFRRYGSIIGWWQESLQTEPLQSG
ncbi:MAG: hypothetical protein AB1427_05240 [Thermodesulfobacteriota bacterium]